MKIVFLILLVLIIVLGYNLIQYMSFNFNSEGNYFDETNMIVYKEQTKEVLIMGTVLLTFCLSVCSYYLWKLKNKKSENQ
ncbi:hypothetical protein [Flavobacterium ginsenosidimutans]|uniref:Uncharacterized protein n=1 Tax=Flavobacterium ginsenosidimutans TaxID=687844 RepID=A0ABZ2QBB5_9FLAO|nr:hypothetical protein [Flavobacterium ginsenosidimutans]KAF2332238.1 hypothetical protein DM444_09755 [Flavobacterium ginsenosidimutans]